jgi:hypothetical protein
LKHRGDRSLIGDASDELSLATITGVIAASNYRIRGVATDRSIDSLGGPSGLRVMREGLIPQPRMAAVEESECSFSTRFRHSTFSIPDIQRLTTESNHLLIVQARG